MLLLQRAEQQRGALAAQSRREEAAEQAGRPLVQPQPQHVVRLARGLEEQRRRLRLGRGVHQRDGGLLLLLLLRLLRRLLLPSLLQHPLLRLLLPLRSVARRSLAHAGGLAGHARRHLDGRRRLRLRLLRLLRRRRGAAGAAREAHARPDALELAWVEGEVAERRVGLGLRHQSAHALRRLGLGLGSGLGLRLGFGLGLV